jgi:methylmalonyl-CoA/ethylmalonyl-CoA epimerase
MAAQQAASETLGRRFRFNLALPVELVHPTPMAMKTTHIEHIGIAVKDLAAAIKHYEEVLGLTCYGVEEVADQKVKTAFFQVGGTKIELLESTSADGPIAKFIDKRGEGVHHIAFAVDDLPAALQHASSHGVQLIDAQPRTGAEGLAIAFLHPKSTMGVLTELCQHLDR